jgi:hypothetical protein
LLNNEKLRSIIQTITSKVVLILGRFTNERLALLQALRDELRGHDYLPVLFDFERTPNRDLTETIITLASLSKFLIVDITEPRSVPQELSHIIPNMPSLPVQPIIEFGHSEYGMFEHFKKYPWVLGVLEYNDQQHLTSSILQTIVVSCEEKITELRDTVPIMNTTKP